MQMPDEVELDDLSGGKNGTPGGGGRRKVSALQLTEVVSAGEDRSASPSPRDLVKKTLHQVMLPILHDIGPLPFSHLSFRLRGMVTSPP